MWKNEIRLPTLFDIEPKISCQCYLGADLNAKYCHYAWTKKLAMTANKPLRSWQLMKSVTVDAIL